MTGDHVVWRAEEALRLVAAAAVLTLAERALLASPLLAGLGGAALLAARVAAVVVFYAALVALLAWYARRRGERLRDAVALGPAPAPRAMRDALAAALVGVFFEVVFLTLLQRVGVPLPPTRDIIEFFGATPAGYAAIVLVGLVVGPLAEEMVFRGAVQPGLVDEFGVRRGIFGTALLFAALHLTAAGFVPFVVLGVMIGWLRERYCSLWPAVLGHAVFNAIALAFSLASR